MTRAVDSHRALASPPPRSRLGFALAASALAHWMLLSAPPWDPLWPGRASYPAIAPMTVRLVPLPVPLPEAPVVPYAGPRRIEPAAQPSEARAAQPAAVTSALPLAPDPHYYPARDLDSYPWPLAPLPLDRPAGERVGTVRLEMMIDETGIVRDVVFVQPARLGQAEEGLRAALAATHFMPARKDGRAARSRITLSVKMGTHTFLLPHVINEEEAY